MVLCHNLGLIESVHLGGDISVPRILLASHHSLVADLDIFLLAHVMVVVL